MPASIEVSESSFNTGDNAINSPIIIGNNNRVGPNTSQPKPVEVPPYDGIERLLVPFGRWIMRTFFHGNMNHSLKLVWLVISVLTVTTGYFSIGRVLADPRTIADNVYLELALLLAFASTISFGGGVLGISRDTKCPNCHQNYMFTRKRRLLTGKAVHRGVEVANYKVTSSCDNCGYTEKSVSEVVERELPASDESLL
jgi:predicted nucleic-acid-binding Zn-ribbon protein